jgi:uncharacterized Zn-binding protein involved in type VI secretion
VGWRISRFVLNIGLLALAGPVLSSVLFQPITAMNLIFALIDSFSPPWAAFWPETGLFPRKTTPPFAAGAALDAPGAEFRPAGASLSRPGAALRRAAVPPCGAEAEVHLPGEAVHGAGAALRQPGAAPILSTEAPAARSGAPAARNGHPAACGSVTKVVRTVPCAVIEQPQAPHSGVCGPHS